VDLHHPVLKTGSYFTGELFVTHDIVYISYNTFSHLLERVHLQDHHERILNINL